MGGGEGKGAGAMRTGPGEGRNVTATCPEANMEARHDDSLLAHGLGPWQRFVLRRGNIQGGSADESLAKVLVPRSHARPEARAVDA